MKEYMTILRRTQLFAGIGEEEIAAMLDCLQAKLCHYEKGEYVFRQGEHLNRIAVLLKGCLHIQNDDYWGYRSLIGMVGVGEMVGEAYAAPDCGPFPNDVTAVEDSAIMFFDINKVLRTCSSACGFHTMTVKNMFFAISQKNRNLMQKIGHVTKRTTREKLMSYLSEEARKNNGSSFSIPFNRRQLADFLAVDRSAMSSELCKMRNEGMIAFEKNHFTLL